jgi:N-methylhydantoinase A/oxoprolinase/acetone carboxylase beta subunit
MTLDVEGARAALEDVGKRVGLDAEETAAAAVRLVDANMTDAVRRVLSLAGADPRKLNLVAFGGMGGVHATVQARALGMSRVVVPAAAAGFSALGLLSANHVIDDSRGYITPIAGVDLTHLGALASELEANARAELRVASVADERIHLEWSLLLVYPGQTFDVSIPVEHPADVDAAVNEFHRRNAEARLIEARAQDPILRGVRLVAVGEVSQPADPALDAAGAPEPKGKRRMYVGDAWHDEVPVYDMTAFRPGVTLSGPAAITGPFTTVIVGPGERAQATPQGDILIDL